MESIELMKTSVIDEFPDYKFKIVLLGDKGVGKTCLANRIINDDYVDNYKPTMQTNFTSLGYTLHSGEATKYVKIHLWDTSGEEMYFSVTKSFMANADAALVLFDLNNKDTWNKVELWIKEIIQISSPIIIYCVGAKMDMNKKEVDEMTITNFIEDYMKSHEENEVVAMKYKRTSSKTGDGVDELFKEVVKMLINQANEKNAKVKPPLGIPIDPKRTKKTDCEC